MTGREKGWRGVGLGERVWERGGKEGKGRKGGHGSVLVQLLTHESEVLQSKSLRDD